MEFCSRYDRHFVGRGRNSTAHARHYISGLMGTQRRKNIETIENDVAGSDYQGMEQFISSSPWCHRALLDDLARGADALLGDPRDTGLNIDESAFLKKGKASAGVARQWSGRAGKVDNCQVGVFASLGRDTRYCLADLELYLPQGWAQDPARCDRAKIPEEHRAYKPKWKLALEMVARARENGVRFGWVGADSLYGHNNQFLRALEEGGEHYMCDVRKDYMMWTGEPATRLAPAPGLRQRPPTLTEEARHGEQHCAPRPCRRARGGRLRRPPRDGHLPAGHQGKTLQTGVGDGGVGVGQEPGRRAPQAALCR